MSTKSWASAALSLLLLLGISMSLVSCGQQVRVTPTPTPNLQAVRSWLKQQAIPLQTTDPQMPLDDLQPLQQMVGSASIVGLGEAAHGSHEFFTMKQRLLEFLVEQMGFTVFAIEGSWTAGQAINNYVLTGQGDPQTLIQDFEFWTWDTQEVLDLVQWIRAYDANPAHTQKVQFAGFDNQVVESDTYDRVEQYVQSVDPQQAGQVASLYMGFRQYPTIDWGTYYESYVQMPTETRQQDVSDAQQVYTFLKGHEAAYEARSSAQAFALALQNARVIVQFTQYMLNSSVASTAAQQERDGFMAENIGWLHEHIAHGKVVVWAHNGHIATGPYQAGVTSMGTHLRQQYGSAYLALGFSFYQGAFNAWIDNGNTIGPLQVFSIQAPSQDSYNYTLGSVDIPLYLLDLRRLPVGSVSEWMDGPHDALFIGATFSPTIHDDEYLTLSLPRYFDVLIHIQQITPSHLLPSACMLAGTCQGSG